MRYELLPRLLEHEGTDFQHIENRWRPTNLLMFQQVRLTLQDMSSRYDILSAAKEELQTLDRADKYTLLLHRMRLWLRQANFKWKADQLSLLQAVSGFYSDYGVVLRFLKVDQARGLFKSSKP